MVTDLKETKMVQVLENAVHVQRTAAIALKITAGVHIVVVDTDLLLIVMENLQINANNAQKTAITAITIQKTVLNALAALVLFWILISTLINAFLALEQIVNLVMMIIQYALNAVMGLDM